MLLNCRFILENMWLINNEKLTTQYNQKKQDMRDQGANKLDAIYNSIKAEFTKISFDPVDVAHFCFNQKRK